MALRLRVLAAFAEDLRSATSTHARQLATTTPVLQGPCTVFQTPLAPAATRADFSTQTICTVKKKIKS